MDDSFDARVKRLFGSRLFENVPDNSFPASSWTVAGGEVERRRWNRESPAGVDREDDPCASAFDEGGCFAKNTKRAKKGRGWELDDDLDDEEEDREDGGEGGGGGEDDPCASAFDEGGCFAKNTKRAKKGRGWELDDDLDDEEEDREDGGEGGGGGEDDGDGDQEEREIRASVGLDPALDHEEEEDEYDRRALNSNSAGDRVYMRDVKDHGPYLNFHSVRDRAKCVRDNRFPDFLEDSEEVHDFSRDPRADHFAASVRLKEDQKAVENGGSSLPCSDEDNKENLHVQTSQDAISVKPILKRKENQTDSKPKKRVRFDPGCEENNLKSSIEKQEDFHMVPQVVGTMEDRETVSPMPDDSSRIPDYLRNPSKYTCYTLDWSNDGDDETNKRAFEDFRNLVKPSKHDQMALENDVELPKSITFTPQKKSHDAMLIDSGLGNSREASSTSIAAGYSTENDVYEMEEDDTSVAQFSVHTRKAGRMYRSKSSAGDDAP